MKSTQYDSRGQAVITVIFIAVIGMFIATGSIFSVANALESSSIQELGSVAFQAAESGIENSVLRLMRDPSYIGGTEVIGANITAVVTVTVSPEMTIQSIGTAGSVSRKIVATVHYDNLMLVIDSWKEIP